jgi:hypothetical protein
VGELRTRAEIEDALDASLHTKIERLMVEVLLDIRDMLDAWRDDVAEERLER